MFARVRATTGQPVNAMVVPDRAVQEQLGKYFLTVVGAEDKAELRPVTLGPRFGNRQVIASRARVRATASWWKACRRRGQARR